MEESQTVDVTAGSTHVNSVESPVKTIDSPKEAVEIVVEQASAPIAEKIEDTSPLGKRIRRASSKYEDVESKTLLVGYDYVLRLSNLKFRTSILLLHFWRIAYSSNWT